MNKRVFQNNEHYEQGAFPKILRALCPIRLLIPRVFLEAIEKCFAKNDKAETSTLLASLILMRYKVKEMQKVPYALAFRSLIYGQVCTRSDLAFIVGTFCRYLINPRLDHWKTTKRVMRYL